MWRYLTGPPWNACDHSTPSGTMTTMRPSTYLLVLSERKAVYWVLSQSRTAFVAGRESQASRLEVGDVLLLYTTRGAWHNPTRDRGQIIGEATVTGPPERFAHPIQVAGREFSLGLCLDVDAVTPCRQGVDLAALVPQLSMFPNPNTWSVRLRTSLLHVPPADHRLIRKRLRPLVQPLADALPGYRKAAQI